MPFVLLQFSSFPVPPGPGLPRIPGPRVNPGPGPPGQPPEGPYYHQPEVLPPPVESTGTGPPASTTLSQSPQLQSSTIDDPTMLPGSVALQLPPHSSDRSPEAMDIEETEEDHMLQQTDQVTPQQDGTVTMQGQDGVD